MNGFHYQKIIYKLIIILNLITDLTHNYVLWILKLNLFFIKHANRRNDCYYFYIIKGKL